MPLIGRLCSGRGRLSVGFPCRGERGVGNEGLVLFRMSQKSRVGLGDKSRVRRGVLERLCVFEEYSLRGRRFLGHLDIRGSESLWD